MYTRSATTYWPVSASFTATVASTAQYTVDAFPSAGVLVRLVSDALCNIKVYRMFSTFTDSVPYQEFNLQGTRTISLPPSKYKVVITKLDTTTNVEIWESLISFVLTEV